MGTMAPLDLSFCQPLRVIDDLHICRSLCGFELRSELFLYRGEQVRTEVGGERWIRRCIDVARIAAGALEECLAGHLGIGEPNGFRSVSNGRHRIDPCGGSGRNITRGGCHHNEQQGGACIGHRVDWVGVEQQARQQAGQR
jgi:hypothetical protein